MAFFARFSITLLSLTLSVDALALTIDPPQCSASQGTVFVEDAGTQARLASHGVTGSTDFLRGMVAVSGCFDLVGRSSDADYILSAGTLSPKQFKQGVAAFASQNVIEPGRSLRIGRMGHAYIQLQDQQTGALAQRSFGQNNRGDVEYSNWPIPQPYQQAAQAVNNTKKSAVMGGALVNAYFELIDKGSVARATAKAKQKTKPRAAKASSGGQLAKVVKQDKDYYSSFINSNQQKPTAGASQGSVTSKSRNKVAVSYSPNHESSTQNLYLVKTLGTFGTDTFSFDEADLGLVTEKLQKFQSWAQTSRDNNMTDIEKELFILRFRQAQIGMFGLSDNNLYTPGRIVILTFRGDEEGKYRLHVSNMAGDGCLSYPKTQGADCRSTKRQGGLLDESAVADILHLLGNVGDIKSKKSKLDLLQ